MNVRGILALIEYTETWLDLNDDLIAQIVGFESFFNLNLVWDLSFSRLFVHRVYRRPFFVVTLTRVCVCV